MKTILFVVIMLLLGFAGFQKYKNFSQENQWQKYHNVKYNYSLSFPPDWQAAADTNSTSTATTIYFYPTSGLELVNQPSMPPKFVHYVSVSILPNPKHFAVPDWYAEYAGFNLLNPPKDLFMENDTLLSHEALRVTKKKKGNKIVKSEQLVEYGDYIMDIALEVSPNDNSEPPVNNFLGIVHTLIFDKE